MGASRLDEGGPLCPGGGRGAGRGAPLAKGEMAMYAVPAPVKISGLGALDGAG